MKGPFFKDSVYCQDEDIDDDVLINLQHYVVMPDRKMLFHFEAVFN